MKKDKSISEKFFEHMLEGMKFQPTLAEEHQEKLREIDQWLQYSDYPGLLITGESGRERIILMRGLFATIRDYNKGLHKKVFRDFTLRKDLCNPELTGMSSTHIVDAIRNTGHKGLLDKDSALLTRGPLFIDDLGAPFEESSIIYRGWNDGHTAYLTEKINPVAELVERRLKMELPTVISTSLDDDGIREKYGACGARLVETLSIYCMNIAWHFEK